MPETPTADPDRSGRALVMGILNVTPDSFSDGGRWLEPDRAVARGIEMIEEGADIVDVGGESTRPGASAVPAEEELRRVLPVVKALSPHVRVSIDTTKEAVAEAAVDAGATLVNDVSASLWAVAARGGVGWVAMHRRGTPTTMQDDPRYDDVGPLGDQLVAPLDRPVRAEPHAAVREGVRGDVEDPHHQGTVLCGGVRHRPQRKPATAGP